MRPVRLGAPLPPYDDLEFRLVRATMGGQPINSIVCEGVAVETVERTMPPSTGWMNNSNDAANQVVQMAAADRRRNMAAISSGTTFVVSPQEIASQSTEPSAGSRAGVQAEATPAVTFANEVAVTEWLDGQSDDVAVLFAARAALRVLPLIKLSPWQGNPGMRRGNQRMTTHEVVLRVFRAVAAAWAVAAYPGQRSLLNNAARGVRVSHGEISTPSLIRAVEFASDAATAEAGAMACASIAISHALDAVGSSKDPKAFELFLQALATDASLLDERFSAVTLANSKLWPGRIPDWISDNWQELRAELLSQNEDWDVWTEWYDERLAGDLANQEIQIARATIENAIWQQSPAAVNAHIKELTREREIFQHAIEDESDELPNVDAIPRQTTTASQFVLDAEGRLDLLPDAPLPDDTQRETYQEVRYKARALYGLGHNQLAEISEPVARFLAAAPERIQDASIAKLWSRGNTLRRRLKAHDTAAASGDPVDFAILSTSVAEMLRDLVESYNVFIVGDPSGRELDQVRLGPQERRRAEVIADLALPIAKAVQESEGLATTAAIEVLTEQMEAARNAPPGLDGDQAVNLSRKTTGNFIVALLRSAREEIGFAWKEIRAGTYRYAGPALIAGGYVSPIITFVAAQASNLKLFVEQAFHNPTLVQIIEVISKFGEAH
jgi:hypothetical protein